MGSGEEEREFEPPNVVAAEDEAGGENDGRFT